jgi:hypothetical protein
VDPSLIAMLTCKEVSRTIASDELATAGWRRRLSVRLHLLMCLHCRRYSRQMREIGTAARRIFGEERPDPDSQDRLRSSILSRIPPSGKDGD